MTRFFALILALCAAAPHVALPPLSSATRDEVQAVRALIDRGQNAAARTRWAAISGWHSANGATAYGHADAIFSARRYRAAFRLYDAVLFSGETSELNPQAQDNGTADRLRGALACGAAGNLNGAKQFLERAVRRDPDSIESRYFLGLVEFARGDAQAARTAWKAAIDRVGYAQPPDGWTIDRAQEAALQRYLSLP